jgi:hypothetical protein
MNKKSIALSVAIVFLILILYLLGLRIRVRVGNINNIRMENNRNEDQVSPSPSEEKEKSHSPSPSYYEKMELKKIPKNSVLGPYGYVTKDMVEDRTNFPHHNPMMYQKPSRKFLNNITE